MVVNCSAAFAFIGFVYIQQEISFNFPRMFFKEKLLWPACDTLNWQSISLSLFSASVICSLFSIGIVSYERYTLEIAIVCSIATVICWYISCLILMRRAEKQI